MWNLFVAEWLRYRNLIVISALAHLLLMVALSTQTNLTHMPLVHFWPMMLTVMAVVAGALQFFNHKRHNNWVQLLHRPLPPERIFAAITLAGISMLGVALVLPYTLVQLYMDFQGSYDIELRHYVFIAALCLQLVAAYMGGAFSVLYSQRLAFLSLFLLWGFLGVSMNINLLALGAVSAAGFGWLLHASWRPDLSRPFHGPLRLVVSELMIQAGMLAALSTVLLLVFQLGWSISSTDPRRAPEAGTANTLMRAADARDLLLAALEGSTHPDSDLLRQQIRIGEAIVAGVANVKSYPRRNQRPELDNNLELGDQEHQVTWHFSHSRMLFEGRHTVTQKVVGWLGTAGFHAAGSPPQDQFTSVPWVTSNGAVFIIDDGSIYRVDLQHQVLQLRFTLAAAQGERFNDSLTFKDGLVTLLSNKNLYLFRSAELLDEEAKKPLAISARLPLPPIYQSELSNYQQHINVMELVDGYLIAVLDNQPVMGTEGDFRKFEDSTLTLYRTHSDGNNQFDNELIHQRSLPSSFSTSFAYKSFVLAPGMHLFMDAWDGVFDNKAVELALPLVYHHFPPLVLLLAVLGCGVSALATYALLRRVNWPASAKITWIVFNACTGLVGLMSLYWGLLYRRELKPGQRASGEARP